MEKIIDQEVTEAAEMPDIFWDIDPPSIQDYLKTRILNNKLVGICKLIDVYISLYPDEDETEQYKQMRLDFQESVSEFTNNFMRMHVSYMALLEKSI